MTDLEPVPASDPEVDTRDVATEDPMPPWELHDPTEGQPDPPLGDGFVASYRRDVEAAQAEAEAFKSGKVAEPATVTPPPDTTPSETQ